MLRKGLVSIFFIAGVSSFAYAQVRDPGSSAFYQGNVGGFVRVDANMLSRNGCGHVVSSGQYAPGGAYVESEAVPLTIVIDMPGGDCGGPRIIRRMTGVSSQLNTTLVKIFFVSTMGQKLKTEKVGIQSN